MSWDEEELEVEFELLNSEEGKIITLVASCSREPDPLEYAQMLREFAERIESLTTMSELSNSTLN